MQGYFPKYKALSTQSSRISQALEEMMSAVTSKPGGLAKLFGRSLLSRLLKLPKLKKRSWVIYMRNNFGNYYKDVSLNGKW